MYETYTMANILLEPPLPYGFVICLTIITFRKVFCKNG